MLRVLSLGAGVQSSTMALMAERGELPRPDCAIFADTQDEPRRVYEYLNWLEQQVSFPIYRVTRGRLWTAATTVRRTRDGERTYIHTGIPVYLVDGLKRGLGLRQCTRTFKIEPIEHQARELLGRRRIRRSEGELVEMMIGISLDEADRMKPSRKPWIRARWPLIEASMTRADCYVWLNIKGYPEPPRSACKYCPFHDDDEWLGLDPDELADVMENMEPELQAAYAQASEMRSVPYLHETRIPLSQVKFRPTGGRDGAKQMSMFRNECAGFCGV